MPIYILNISFYRYKSYKIEIDNIRNNYHLQVMDVKNESHLTSYFSLYEISLIIYIETSYIFIIERKHIYI